MDTPQQTALFETSRDLLSQQSPEAVAELAVETAQRVLELPINGIYLADAGVLQPTAVTDVAVDHLGEPPRFEAGDSLAWRAFETGEPLSHDGRETDTAGLDSELAVPLGDHGVFLAGSMTPTTFDDNTVSLVGFLAECVELALDQLNREQQLRQQQAQLDAFIGNISHDLRSPLAVAKAGITVMRKTGTDDSLNRVDRAHERIQTLIDDLLTLAREGTTLEAADLEAVELSAVVADAWNAVETAAADIEVDADKTVIANRSRLQQLLENLFRNGVEHGSTSSQPPAKPDPVTIRVGLLGSGFYVEDDGAGIAAADREAVFEAGYSTRDGGTGLGLRIVRTVVDAHGWEVTVTAAADGGARFEITGIEDAAAEGDRAGEHA